MAVALTALSMTDSLTTFPSGNDRVKNKSNEYGQRRAGNVMILF